MSSWYPNQASSGPGGGGLLEQLMAILSGGGGMGNFGPSPAGPPQLFGGQGNQGPGMENMSAPHPQVMGGGGPNPMNLPQGPQPGMGGMESMSAPTPYAPPQAGGPMVQPLPGGPSQGVNPLERLLAVLGAKQPKPLQSMTGPPQAQGRPQPQLPRPTPVAPRPAMPTLTRAPGPPIDPRIAQPFKQQTDGHLM